MFLPDNKIERDSLKQGDIISNIHCIGALNLNGMNYITNSNGVKIGWAVNKKPDFLDCMILSHSCEIAKENDVKVTGIILAPLRDVNKATRPNKMQELITSNIIKDGITATYLKYFYVESNDKFSIKCDKGVVADFSKCFSVRKQTYDMLLKHKIIQLNDVVVQKMALKLSLYYFRTAKNG